MSKLFIAYGSNLSLEQMARRCPQASVVAAGALNGYRLRFRGMAGHGVANIERSASHAVPVLIWEVNEIDEAALDAYEGVPTLYEKQLLTVTLPAQRLQAWAYVMRPGHALAAPAGAYFETILRGYMAAEFGDRQLGQLMAAREEAENAGARGPRTRWL